MSDSVKDVASLLAAKHNKTAPPVLESEEDQQLLKEEKGASEATAAVKKTSASLCNLVNKKKGRVTRPARSMQEDIFDLPAQGTIIKERSQDKGILGLLNEDE